MAAVLCCGPGGRLSHDPAAALWAIRTETNGAIEVSLQGRSGRRRTGIVIHRPANLRPDDIQRHRGIPVTSPICTLVDLAARLGPAELEAAVNEADRRDLTNPETLRMALDRMTRRPGVGRLREVLDRRTFTLTDSQLERIFLPLARRVGLPQPETQR
jgi:hypothetical protein